MEFSCQVHAIVSRDGGLQLWVERTEGRVVVTDAATLGSGDLPPELLDLLLVRPLRLRGKLWVATPKGRLKSVAIPTLAFTPEQSLNILGKLAEFAPKKMAPSGGSGSALSPEVLFLINTYRFALDVVCSGRVMLRMDRVDDQWYPRWMPSTAGKHHHVLERFRQTVPEVLAFNGGEDVVGEWVDDLVHWMTVAILTAEMREVETPFIKSIMQGEPARRVAGETVASFNRWRVSAADAASRVVLVLSSPSDATLAASRDVEEGTVDVDLEDVHWRLDISLSLNDGPVETLKPAEMTEMQSVHLHKAIKHMIAAWEPMGEILVPVQKWMSTGVWNPDPELITGDSAQDRLMSVSINVRQVEELLTEGIGVLRSTGTQVMVPRGWAQVTPKVKVAVKPAVGSGPGSGKLGIEQLVDFQWDVSVGGSTLTPESRAALLDTAGSVVAVNGQFVFLDKTSLTRARNWLRELTKDAEPGEDGEPQVTMQDVMRADALASEGKGTHPSHDFRIEADGWMRRLFSREPVDPPRPVRVPETVVTELRDHQRRGVNWLAWMSEHRLGAILADDMGLGKTLQVLGLIAWEIAEDKMSEQARTTLVIAPTSVLEAWRAEAHKHVPRLSVLIDHGSGRVADEEFAQTVQGLDVVVTSYGTVSRNPERYGQVIWRRVVADEAQNIKNPGTKQSRAVRQLRADHRIALTGTPVENRLSDLYALMDFANPGILGSLAAFQNQLAIPAERYGDESAKERIQRVVEPFVMRRLKTDENVGLELPKKQDKVELISLTDEQAALYQAFLENMKEQIRAKKSARKGIILGSLVKIKQICNHPAHFTGDGSGLLRNGQHRSYKVQRLMEIVDEALQNNRKVLVFTQFPSFGRMLIPEMERRFGVEVPMLSGEVPRGQRIKMVRTFQSADGPPIMVLSVRAGGTGITLTEASVVIHVDRWWNPAVEDQATDRAYRIGQDKDVTVYKLVTKGTLDERIHDIIAGKRELAGAVVTPGEGWIANLNDEELDDLWRLRVATEKSRKGLK